jgi:beta-lactamase class A
MTFPAEAVTKDEDRFAELGFRLLKQLVEAQKSHGLTPEDVAISWTLYASPLRQDGAVNSVARFVWRDGQPFYPCSVVKLFWLLACQARLEESFIRPHSEIDRAMADMIRWSSNTATNYIVDLVTGTTGDTLLEGEAYAAWAEERNWANRYFRGLGWEEVDAGVNVCQKAMDDDRYGRERQFLGQARDNHNSLTSRATSRLLQEVLCGTVLTQQRCRTMAALMQRSIEPASVADDPRNQVKAYLGGGLPDGSRLWSKAGWTTWTGDPKASWRRHDAAYVEAPHCLPFTLVVFTQGVRASEDDAMLPMVGRTACELLREL